MLLRIIETDGAERIIVCKSFEVRIDKALINLKFETGEAKEIQNVSSVKCVG